MLGWWIVQTTFLPVSNVFLTVRTTIAAALASRPDVGSSMKMIDGLATNSTAIVSLFSVQSIGHWLQGGQLEDSWEDIVQQAPLLHQQTSVAQMEDGKFLDLYVNQQG